MWTCSDLQAVCNHEAIKPPRHLRRRRRGSGPGSQEKRQYSQDRRSYEILGSKRGCRDGHVGRHGQLLWAGTKSTMGHDKGLKVWLVESVVPDFQRLQPNQMAGE